tara:strand:- start:312 stop:959 length:648 start_codon:yes stop_codon:yes gene_type:complete
MKKTREIIEDIVGIDIISLVGSQRYSGEYHAPDYASTQPPEFYPRTYIPLNIPFVWDTSTSDKFPYYRHQLVQRNSECTPSSRVTYCSLLFPFFKQLVDTFCAKHDIEYKNIIRACINNTYHIPGYEYQDPHVDDIKDHLVLIMYLNDVSGNTIIFDKTYDGKNVGFYNGEQFPILKQVKPALGKILCFDGAYYHTIRSPAPGENRSICIFNLLT